MKKIATILLLALFLFNLVGYKAMFYYVQQQSDRQLESSLDNGFYNEADLITIKIPLSNPYQVNHPDFERVDGEINVKGIIYKYVKRKVSGGQLILLCLPDAKKMSLQKAKDDFFKSTNDLVQHNGSKNTQHSKNTAVKNIESDYDCYGNQYAAFTGKSRNTQVCINICEALISTPHISPEQPPDLA